jgi:hypothetical protein
MTESEGVPHIETSPRLVDIVQLAKAENTERPNTVIYVPPVLGSVLSPEVVQQFSGSGSDLWRVNVHKYGYPRLQEYVDQLRAQLESHVLVGKSPEDVYLVGYSSGCAVAAETGIAMGLPKDHILSVAPPLPFLAFLTERIEAAVRLAKAWRNAGAPVTLRPNEQFYFRQFVNKGDMLHGGRKSIIPGHEKYREGKQWHQVGLDLRTTRAQLHGSTVISGETDVLSPVSKFSRVVVPQGGHGFGNFVPAILQFTSRK